MERQCPYLSFGIPEFEISPSIRSQWLFKNDGPLREVAESELLYVHIPYLLLDKTKENLAALILELTFRSNCLWPFSLHRPLWIRRKFWQWLRRRLPRSASPDKWLPARPRRISNTPLKSPPVKFRGQGMLTFTQTDKIWLWYVVSIPVARRPRLPGQPCFWERQPQTQTGHA